MKEVKTTYNNYATRIELEETEEVVIKKEPKTGKVIGCGKLNVREKPTTESDAISTIKCGTEVEVDEDGSTYDFYKVCLVSGVEGFCMKKFIAIQ